MKILAFTDLHLSLNAFKKLRSKVKSQNPDIIVCAGDVSIFNNGLKAIMAKLNKFGKKILIIPGNHETDSEIRKACKKCKNLVFIHNKYYKEGNFIFLGYGGGGFSLIDPGFKKAGRKFEKILKKNKDKQTVLVTHAPPYGTKVDLISGIHCGNQTIRNFIIKNKINLSICGHLHETFNKQGRIRKTEVVNPGPYGKIIKI